MGGERSSVTRRRLAGKICTMCRRPLDYNIWDANPGERLCDRCIAEKANPTGPLRKVYMSFFHRDGWQCQFLEADLKTLLPRRLVFATDEKVTELVLRGGGLKDLADRQALESGLQKGTGGAYLYLTAKQYEELKRR
jgi:hypothetical protein